MNSKPSSPKTEVGILAAAIEACLTSAQFHDTTGKISVNLVDALMQIANAIHRVAAVKERALENAIRSNERTEAMLLMMKSKLSDDIGPGGHA